MECCFPSCSTLQAQTFLKTVITSEKDTVSMLSVGGGLFSPLHSNYMMVSVTSYI